MPARRRRLTAAGDVFVTENRIDQPAVGRRGAQRVCRAEDRGRTQEKNLAHERLDPRLRSKNARWNARVSSATAQ